MLNRIVFSVLVLCAAAAPSFCANEIYLQLTPALKGSGDDKDHKDWIEVVSINNLAKTGQAGPIVITKKTDIATPCLQNACVLGTPYVVAKIEVCTADANKARYYTITLSNLVITQIKQVISNPDDANSATEELTCTYGRIEWQYNQLNAGKDSGPAIKTDWDNKSGGKK